MPIVIANDVPLYYEVSGSGEPILWIQGLGADHTAWLGQINDFSRSYRCVAFDNRDVGLSGRVAQTYTVRDMAEDAAQLLAKLDLAPAHIVGLSMGGSIAQELALRHPQSVRSLVLVSSMARPDARLRHLVSVWANLYPKVGAVDFYRQAALWLFTYRFFERPRSIPALLRYAENHAQDAAAFRRQAAAGLDHDTLDRLSTLSAPTLVISGEEDILVPIRLSRTLATAIPGAYFTVIAQAGHSVNVEQSVAFNLALREFLAHVNQST